MSENKITTDTQNSLQGIVDIVYLTRDNCEITEKNGFIGIKAILDKSEDSPSPDMPPMNGEGTPPPPHGGSPMGGPMGGPPPHGDAPMGGTPPMGNEPPLPRHKRDDTPAVTVKDLGNGKVEKVADRVHLSRAFPFDKLWEYISVLDRDKKEIGFIRSLDDFPEPARSLLVRELEATYYTPKIRRILSLKERYGFSYWKCECEFGEKTFTLQDTFRSIVKTYTKEGALRLFILDVDGNRYEIPDAEALDRASYKKIELYL